MNNYLNKLNNDIVILDIKKQILNNSTLYDRLDIEHREKNTYYSKILGLEDIKIKVTNENKYKNIVLNNCIKK